MMIRDDLMALCQVPGLSGHEARISAAIRGLLPCDALTDVMGNLICTFKGTGPSVMLFTHMDQLGFIVRKVDTDGMIRVHRMGGVPERALPAQAVVLSVGDMDIPGVIASRSHHATPPEDKYTVLRASDLYIDCGFSSADEATQAGIRIGTPVTYAPRVIELANGRIAATSVDDRAGCAVLIDVARSLSRRSDGPNVHIVFSTQEEFNLRGAQTAAQALQPDIAVQIDLMLASDTPDAGDLGEMRLGGGPGMSLYSFHGRGTLNGVIPHPGLVALAESVAGGLEMPLQRSAQVGVLTDLSYVQLVGHGVAALDLGFPMRYSHSALEVVDVADLEALSRLLKAMIAAIGPEFRMERWA